MNDAQAVQRILNLPDTDVNAVDGNGKTALHVASEAGFDEVVERILDHADTEVEKLDKRKQTALELACQQNEVKVKLT